MIKQTDKKTELETRIQKVIFLKRELSMQEDKKEISSKQFKKEYDMLEEEFRKLSQERIAILAEEFRNSNRSNTEKEPITSLKKDLKKVLKKPVSKTPVLKKPVLKNVLKKIKPIESVIPKKHETRGRPRKVIVEIKPEVLDVQPNPILIKPIAEQLVAEQPVKQLVAEQSIAEQQVVEYIPQTISSIILHDNNITFETDESLNDMILKLLKLPNYDVLMIAKVIQRNRPSLSLGIIIARINRLISIIKNKSDKRYFKYSWDDKKHMVKETCQTTLF
jgi:hypothetical protein